MKLSVFTLLALAVAASTAHAATASASDAELGSLNADATSVDYTSAPDLNVEIERDLATADGEEQTTGTQPAFLVHTHLMRNVQSPDEAERMRALGLRLLSQGVALNKITGGDKQHKALLSAEHGSVKTAASSPHSSIEGLSASAHAGGLQRRRAARRDFSFEAETSEISTPDAELLDEDEDDYEDDNAPSTQQQAKDRKMERSSDAHPDDDEDDDCEVAHAQVQIGREI